MKKLIVAAALSAALLAQPAFAQKAADAEADLVCAGWAAAGSDQAKTDEEKNALTMLLFYFVGRWEAATGKGIEQGMTVEWVSKNVARIDGAGEGCLKRGGELAQRMMAAGDRLQKAGEGK